MSGSGDYGLVSTTLGALPVVNHIVERLGLPGLLEEFLPAGDERLKLAPATAVRLVVANLVVGREPLYGLGEWLGRTDFLYVADSKLCSREAMTYIAARGGRFVTVLPRSRKEDGQFNPPPRGTASCGCTPGPKPLAMPPPARPASRPEPA